MSERKQPGESEEKQPDEDSSIESVYPDKKRKRGEDDDDEVICEGVMTIVDRNTGKAVDPIRKPEPNAREGNSKMICEGVLNVVQRLNPHEMWSRHEREMDAARESGATPSEISTLQAAHSAEAKAKRTEIAKHRAWDSSFSGGFPIFPKEKSSDDGNTGKDAEPTKKTKAREGNSARDDDSSQQDDESDESSVQVVISTNLVPKIIEVLPTRVLVTIGTDEYSTTTRTETGYVLIQWCIKYRRDLFTVRFYMGDSRLSGFELVQSLVDFHGYNDGPGRIRLTVKASDHNEIPPHPHPRRTSVASLDNTDTV